MADSIRIDDLAAEINRLVRDVRKRRIRNGKTRSTEKGTGFPRKMYTTG